MMYNPYQPWGMMGGMSGMGPMGIQAQGGNPYMAAMMAQQNQSQNPVQGVAPGQGQGGGGDGGLMPYDSGKMKQGRMGHYGYLEGRGTCFVCD